MKGSRAVTVTVRIVLRSKGNWNVVVKIGNLAGSSRSSTRVWIDVEWNYGLRRQDEPGMLVAVGE